MGHHEEETRVEEASHREVYYFCYGPVCNEMVRKRREIVTKEIKAAYVPDYRLTFAIGGIASIVAKVGFEAHGLLMKVNPEDWEKLKKFEAGNEPKVRNVVPYNADSQPDDDESDSEDDHNADDDFLAVANKCAVSAYLIEHPENVEDAILDAPIERLPQERYLKLIARGMRQYGVDEDYITDHIEACPFTPTRKREEYYTFPVAKKVKKIAMSKYEQLCARAKAEGDIYFVLGKRVFRCGEHDPANPLAKWFQTHGHGKPDCTYMLHLTVVDPDIPLIYDAKDVTPLHIAWAENHCVEIVEQYSMSATQVYEISDEAKEAEDTEESEDASVSSVGRPCWMYFFCPFGKKDR